MSDEHPAERLRWSWPAARSGVRALLPLTIPVPFFGLVFGVLVQESEVVPNLAGWSSSWLVFGGASQIAAVVVLDDGGGLLIAVATILVLNARHVMYSAACQPLFRSAPGWFRLVGPYFLVDQVFAVMESESDSLALSDRINLFLGAGVFWWALWLASVAVGISVGNVVPESLAIEFTVPLLFLGLLINALRDRPGVAAAAASAVVAVAARDLQPAGSGLILAAAVGMATGATLDRWLVDGNAGQNGAGPDSAEPDSAEPDSAVPDSGEPDTVGPNTAEPDSGEPDTVGPRPDARSNERRRGGT